MQPFHPKKNHKKMTKRLILSRRQDQSQGYSGKPLRNAKFSESKSSGGIRNSGRGTTKCKKKNQSDFFLIMRAFQHYFENNSFWTDIKLKRLKICFKNGQNVTSGEIKRVMGSFGLIKFPRSDKKKPPQYRCPLGS